MVNQNLWIGIVVGVFIVGIGVSYAVFQANNLSNFMVTTPQQMQQMMMGSSPVEEHEMMLELMGTMQENENLMNHMFAHMMEDERTMHNMLTIMSEAPHLKDHMAAHVSGDLSEYAYLDEEGHEEHIHDDDH